MKHTLQISVSKKPKNDGIAAVRKVSVREKFLRFLFGDKTRLTVIVPGDTVQELEIREIGKGHTKTRFSLSSKLCGRKVRSPHIFGNDPVPPFGRRNARSSYISGNRLPADENAAKAYLPSKGLRNCPV